jgi:endonuclease/exonuclease/phosphatase family metal-dependent hydrolase
LGDFNEWSRTGGLAPLKDAFDIIAPGKSFHASRPIAALDRIALDASLELRDAGVVETDLSRRASDHLPIWADVAMVEQKNTP